MRNHVLFVEDWHWWFWRQSPHSNRHCSAQIASNHTVQSSFHILI